MTKKRYNAPSVFRQWRRQEQIERVKRGLGLLALITVAALLIIATIDAML